MHQTRQAILDFIRDYPQQYAPTVPRLQQA